MCMHTQLHAQVISYQVGGWMTSREKTCIREGIDWVIATFERSNELHRLFDKWLPPSLSCTKEEEAVAEAEVELEVVQRRQRQLTQDARAGRAGRADEGTSGGGNGRGGMSGGVRRALMASSAAASSAAASSAGNGNKITVDQRHAMTLVDMFGLYIMWLVVTALVLIHMLFNQRAQEQTSKTIKQMPSHVQKNIGVILEAVNLVEHSGAGALGAELLSKGEGEASSKGAGEASSEGKREAKSEGKGGYVGVLSEVDCKVLLGEMLSHTKKLEGVLSQLSKLTPAQPATAVASELQQASPVITVQPRIVPHQPPSLHVPHMHDELWLGGGMMLDHILCI